MPALSLSAITLSCSSSACDRAVLVLSTAHDSSSSLLQAYELARHQRGRPRGMTTDNEQDLLRSMLVMAAAGLDSTAKYLIQDSLALLVTLDDKSQNAFEKFVARRLAVESTGSGLSGSKLLAAALTAANPQTRLIQEYIEQLTGSSLQSVDSLFEVAAALGVDPAKVGLSPAELRPIFQTRNMIIHELDINLDSPRRTRNVRGQQAMIEHTNRLFHLASGLIASVDTRLSALGK